MRLMTRDESSVSRFCWASTGSQYGIPRQLSLVCRSSRRCTNTLCFEISTSIVISYHHKGSSLRRFDTWPQSSS